MYIEHLPGTTAKVTLQLAAPIRLVEVQMKNPDVSLEMLKSFKTPSSAAERQDKNEINKVNLSFYNFLYVNASNGKQAHFAAYKVVCFYIRCG